MRSEFCCAFHFYSGFNLLILTIFASSFSPKTIAQLVNSFTHEEDKSILAVWRLQLYVFQDKIVQSAL